MDELGLPFYGREHPESRLVAAARPARDHLLGRLSSRELCRAVHTRFGHQAHDLIEPLAVLDDCYDTLEYHPGLTEADLERDVADAARRLLTEVDERIDGAPATG